MADFDRTIPPGGGGKITLMVKTASYEGPHRWGAEVLTNDPTWKNFALEVSAFVKPIIYVAPKQVWFQGKKDKAITKTVEVKAATERPLSLQVAQFSLQGAVTYNMAETTKGKAFKITFKTIPGRKEGFNGFLKLRTNYPEKPLVIIYMRN